MTVTNERRKRKRRRRYDYTDNRRDAAAHSRERSTAGREIGPCPKPADTDRREESRRSLTLFCETYLAATFHCPWSDDHLWAIRTIEQIALHGGRAAFAMPRGTGKTALTEAACMWAVTQAHRFFPALIGSDEDHAVIMLESIRTELETNELLIADFPEICYPIQALEGIGQRCKGQTSGGVRTRITWTDKTLVLPTITGSAVSGSVIKTRGITGRIRGLKHKLADGRTIRPDFVIVDDPQTDESARSESQTEHRLRTLNKTVLKLAGPQETISVAMPCTVIESGDLADQTLDRGKHPEWNGIRTKLLYEFPTDMGAWERYIEILRTGAGDDQQRKAAATEYYRENREAMDAGARVGWEYRYESEWQLSALQFAMTEYLLDADAFNSEYQNDPADPSQPDDDLLSVEQIAAKVHPQTRGVVPLDASVITSFVDVQDRLLYHATVAWVESSASGYVIDYGTWPRQKLLQFTLAKAQATLRRKYPGAGREGAIYRGLMDLIDSLRTAEYRREDGVMLKNALTLIDAGHESDIVKRVIRERRDPDVQFAFGRGIKATQAPMAFWQRQVGEKVGHHYRIRTDSKSRLRYWLVDANFWKSFVHARLSTGLGDPGSLSLYSDPDGQTGRHRGLRHRMIAEHLRAERRDRVTAEGSGLHQTQDEWSLPSHRPDNHLFDCIVGCAAAAKERGVNLVTAGETSEKRPKIRLSERQKRRRA